MTKTFCNKCGAEIKKIPYKVSIDVSIDQNGSDNAVYGTSDLCNGCRLEFIRGINDLAQVYGVKNVYGANYKV